MSEDYCVPTGYFVKRGVVHDGNCGPRSLAHILLGSENKWFQIVEDMLKLLEPPTVLFEEQRQYLEELKEAYGLFASKSKLFKGWDSKHWLRQDILDLYSKSIGVVSVVLMASEKRKNYNMVHFGGAFNTPKDGELVASSYLFLQ